MQPSTLRPSRRRLITLSMHDFRRHMARFFTLIEINGFTYVIRQKGKPQAVFVPAQRVRGLGDSRLPKNAHRLDLARQERHTRRRDRNRPPVAIERIKQKARKAA